MTARNYLPLKGIRILSFEIAFALPAGTRALSDLGADVIRVAPPGGNPLSRYISVIDGVFHGKPCISIDLTREEGREIAFKLAMKADVVCNNFRPTVMDKYGLGTARLRRSKPSLICLQLSGYGTPGPWSSFPAYGPSTEAAGGLNRLLVDEGEVPIRIGTGVFADQLSGRHAALAIVSALEKKRDTGLGASIDLSMTECITHLLGSLMVQAAVSGNIPRAQGNRDPRYAPQGVYPCKGDDEWIAISITSDNAWLRFVEIVGEDLLDSGLTLEERLRQHDQIDEVLADWTPARDKNELTSLLQEKGIAASPVRTTQDSAQDPQFKARGSLKAIKHRQPLLDRTTHPHPTLPWRIVGRNRKALTDFRNSGQDNETVLNRWLGLERRQVRKLERQGVLSDSGPVEIAVRRSANEIHDPDFGRKLGSTE